MATMRGEGTSIPFDRMLETPPHAVAVFRDGACVYANRAHATLFGAREPAAMLGWSPELLVAEEDRSAFALSLVEQEAAGESLATVVRGLRRDGSTFGLEARLSFHRAGDGRFTLLLAQDVGERQRREEALAVLNATVASAACGIVLADAAGQLTFANRALLALLGHRPDHDFAGTPLAELFAEPDEAGRVLDALRDRGSWSGEADLRRADGSPLPVALQAQAVRVGSRTCLQASMVDIRARRRLEEQSLVHEKLDSLGVLADGIAHDFNNLLTIIQGNLELAKTHATPDSRAYPRLVEAEKACVRAETLTRQLFAFARQGTPSRRATSIRHLLMETVPFSLSGSSIRCDYAIADDLWPAEVDEGQIGQVVHNLVENAVEAMPEGGTIRVACRNLRVVTGEIFPLEPGPYVRVTIEDWGDGIPPQHLHRIFDPHFTTKQEGTGIGLTTALSVVKRHGGHIEVESKQGVGTKVHVYLPASEERAVPAPDGENGHAAPARVLVMDDDEAVRRLAGEMLESAGYEAVLAADGARAVALFREARASGRPFSAVLLDLTVPGGMGGAEAMRALRALDPGVRAIVSSGYVEDPVLRNHARHGFAGVAAKPYRRNDLVATVNRIVRPRC